MRTTNEPVLSSLFEVHNRSPWALTYSFESVLEKHHAAETHKLLFSHKTDILSNLSPQERNYITSLITRAILSTDMALHGSLIEDFQRHVAREFPFDKENINDRKFLVSFVLHCAGNLLMFQNPALLKLFVLISACLLIDIGAQTQDISIAMKWTKRVNDEFMKQVAREKERDLPLTDYMTGLESPAKRYKSQVGFIAGLVLPLWGAIAAFFPSLQAAVNRCIENETHYQDRFNELDAVMLA